MKNERFKHPMRGDNNKWVHIVAERQAQTHQPADETVHQLHNEVEQLRSQARRATERAESFQIAWDTHLGPASKIEAHGTYQDYLGAQDKHVTAQNRIILASKPENHEELLAALDAKAQQKTSANHNAPNPQRPQNLARPPISNANR